MYACIKSIHLLLLHVFIHILISNILMVMEVVGFTSSLKFEIYYPNFHICLFIITDIEENFVLTCFYGRN